MAKYRKLPVEIEAVTFDEFIEYGKANCDHLTNGYPWSFDYKGHPVTHENDMCYLVPTIKGTMQFTPKHILITSVNGDLYPLTIAEFDETSEQLKHDALLGVVLPDDIQAYDAVMKLRKELKDKGKDESLADINGWLMGVNWCKDFITGKITP